MTYEIKGQLVDPSTSPSKPLSNYIIKMYDEDPFPRAIDDDEIGKAVTLDDGSFSINFKLSDFKKSLEFWDSDDPQLYFKIYDLDGSEIKKTGIVNTAFTPYTNAGEVGQCEAVVIGSGFGGTITSLSLVNKYVKDAQTNPSDPKKKVVVLERGQWWVSHELPKSPGSHEFEDLTKTPDERKGIREFLESKNMPYKTWPYPDNISGLSQMIDNLHNNNNRYGLLNYRISQRVHTLTASGVGGGSLVYTNVTEEPHESIIDAWDTDLNLGINSSNLSQYFDMARGFIGVNKIATNSSIGDVKLPRSKAFHDAAKKMLNELPAGTITNKSTLDPAIAANITEDIFAADLSISDIPYRKDIKTLFKAAGSYTTTLNDIQTKLDVQEKVSELLRKYNIETNPCQRQGRCAIGCIPGARHTNNKKLFDYLKNNVKKDHFEVGALSEVYDIEPLDTNTSSFKYKIYYNDYGAREKKTLAKTGQ